MIKQISNLTDNLSRREFLAGISVAGVTSNLSPSNLLASTQQKSSSPIKICLFSKHLQWIKDYKSMAETATELGFDGVELTIRADGHVKPERAKDDLPKVVEAVKKAGIEVPMVCSSIIDPKDPNTEPILKTASQLGIQHYRLGYWHYPETMGILEFLNSLKPQMIELAAMNKQYKIVGAIQNHTGNYVGGSLWDAWEVFKDVDPAWLGFQFDTGNAFAEGAAGTWKTNARMVASRIKTLAVKTQAEWRDPEWQKTTPKSPKKWNVQVPDDFKWFFGLMKKIGFAGPLTTHYEFPLGGADTGAKELKGITKQALFTVLRENLKILRTMISEA